MALGAAALLAGCAPAAKLVLVEPGGGAVAIRRNTAKGREQALELIARQCPRGYDIVREEEVVVGERVTREYNTEYDRIREGLRTTEEQRSRVETEWRITYTCR
jgi:hypothetical protein